MQIDDADLNRITGHFETLKKGEIGGVAQQRLPQVVRTVSAMLAEIERDGMDAVLRYARDLDGWDRDDVVVPRERLARTGDSLDSPVRDALQLGAARTRRFADAQRAAMRDQEFELEPGLTVGYRYRPVPRVGAYLPAGQFPILASAFMTVGVAKAAGVEHVSCCTPPVGRAGAAGVTGGNDAVLYAAHLSGVDQAYVRGGVQALAALAFGLLDGTPVDMVVGAGNAYVTEAKRQLFGRVGIDLLAGPSEVAVIADATADPQLVAADLLGQAEHGPQSPASLVTTSRALAEQVLVAIEQQLAELATRDIAGPAWRDYGTVYVAQDRQTAVQLMDVLAPEHLEILTEDDDWYHDQLSNYGSLFLGAWSTVAYSDKGMAGTNHVLPTGRGARASAGLSVARYLRPLTYQRITREATPSVAPAVEAIASFEGMAAHERTATMRRVRHGLDHNDSHHSTAATNGGYR